MFNATIFSDHGAFACTVQLIDEEGCYRVAIAGDRYYQGFDFMAQPDEQQRHKSATGSGEYLFLGEPVWNPDQAGAEMQQLFEKAQSYDY